VTLFHISHNDLDGYGCHLVSSTFVEVDYCFNASYGLEVQEYIKSAFATIESEKQDAFILITDVNLTLQESESIQNEIDRIQRELSINIDIQLLDHHISGQDCADKYEWYYLDVSRSATKITYDYFLENRQKFKLKDVSFQKWLSPLVDAINAVDIWLSDQTYNFEFGKVCMRLINNTHEINKTLFSNENREFRLTLLREAAIKFLGNENGNVEFDDALFFMKKSYLSNGTKQIDTLDNISSKYIVKLLEKNRDLLTLSFGEHKCLVTFTLGSISIVANAFLEANSDYSFFMDVGRRGTISLRANNKIDVSQLAKALCGGGGHKNAAGGKFKQFEETFLYPVVKEFIKKELDKVKLKEEVPKDYTTLEEEDIKEALKSCKKVAIVGLSEDESKPSNRVAKYLLEHNIDVYPVYPKCDYILERKVYRNLHDIDDNIDIAVIFRKSDSIPKIVPSILKKDNLETVWFQEGIVHEESAKEILNSNKKVVQNACIKKKYDSLLSLENLDTEN
jgi:oligoribonuclease NrnB/cAMP/cGMP phosphodiesterase (DHH superfamily)